MLEIAIFLLLCFLAGYLLKKYKKGESYFYLITLLRSKKYLWILDKLKFLPMEFIADLGIISGFGMLGVIYLLKQNAKMHKLMKAAVFCISAFILYFIISALISSVSSPLLKSKGIIGFLHGSFVIMGFAGFSITTLILQAIEIISKYLTGVRPCPGIAPVVPGVSLPNVPITLPFYAWIPLFLILVIHELSHGIIARKFNVSMKSVGILLFGFLPLGAFVEPDDEDMKKLPKLNNARIYATGPIANFIVFILAALFFSLILQPAIVPQMKHLREIAVEGIFIESVTKETEFCGETFQNSAYGILKPGMQILMVNNKPIKTLFDFMSAAQKDPNKIELTYRDLNGVIHTRTFKKNKMGLIGIAVKEKQKKNFNYSFMQYLQLVFLFLLSGIMHWFIWLNLVVAIVNFLPIVPFDGFGISRIILPELLAFTKLPLKTREDIIVKFFTGFLILLFAINIIPLFI